MFSIVPVLDELVSHQHQPFLRNISLMDDFRNSLGYSNEVKTIEDNDKQLTLAVNCESFKPEDIKVKIDKNNFIVIEANYEQKDEHNYIKRQFSRKFLLPENAEQEKMNCQLSQNGVLKVIIPKKAKAIKNEAINIPIQFSK